MKDKKNFWAEILVFFILWLSYSYFFQYSDDNSRSRLALSMAIVKDHSFQIDKYHRDTIDIAYYNGHYYSNKPPGLSVWAAPFYVALFYLFPSMDDSVRRCFLVIFTISLFSAVLGVIYFKFSKYFLETLPHRLLITFSIFLGTLLFPYSTLFYGEMFSAILFFISFYLLYKSLKVKYSPKNVFFAGIISSLGLITVYPTALIFISLFIYLVFSNCKSIKYFILGTLPLLLVQGYYNLICFDSPFKVAYQYHLPGSEFQVLTAKGLFGIGYPSFTILLKSLISPAKGIFIFSPVLLLSILGLWGIYKRGLKKEVVFLCSAIGLFLLYNSGYSNWEGGLTVGTRYLIPVFPFLGFCLLGLNRKYYRYLIPVAIFSFLINFSITATATHIAENEKNPIINVIFKRITTGNLGYNWGNLFLGLKGYYSLLPYFLLLLLLFIGIGRKIKI